MVIRKRTLGWLGIGDREGLNQPVGGVGGEHDGGWVMLGKAFWENGWLADGWGWCLLDGTLQWAGLLILIVEVLGRICAFVFKSSDFGDGLDEEFLGVLAPSGLCGEAG